MSGQVAVTGALFIDCGTGREDPTTGAVRYWKPPRARYECLLCGGREGPVSEAERSIHGLIKGAADVSGWAVDIGADGLEPEEHSMTVKSAGRPIARAYFAFAPDVSESMREAFVTGIGEVAAHQLRLAQEEAAAVTIPSEPAAHVLFQERLGGWPPSTFAAKLLNLWTSADTANAECLATAFPEYAAAIALVKSGPSGIEHLRAIADGT
jgi:hypothetical protein